MSRWFRMYDAVLDDPKVQRLSDPAFRAWVNLMCIASRNQGIIAENWKDLAFSLRKSEGKTRDLVQTLVSAGLVDIVEKGFEPHNWSARQYKSDVSTERVKRFRERSETVSETPPEQKQSRAEQNTSKPDKPGHSKPYPEEFEKFWLAYPTDKNMSKKTAYQQWQKLSPEKRIAAFLAMPGFKRYCTENKSWYRVIYADRFLKEEKFAGYAPEHEPTAEEIAEAKDKSDRLLKRGAYDPMREMLQ